MIHAKWNKIERSVRRAGRAGTPILLESQHMPKELTHAKGDFTWLPIRSFSFHSLKRISDTLWTHPLRWTAWNVNMIVHGHKETTT